MGNIVYAMEPPTWLAHGAHRRHALENFQNLLGEFKGNTVSSELSHKNIILYLLYHIFSLYYSMLYLNVIHLLHMCIYYIHTFYIYIDTIYIYIYTSDR